MASNIDNALVCGHVQSKLDNLRTQIKEFIDLQKVA